MVNLDDMVDFQFQYEASTVETTNRYNYELNPTCIKIFDDVIKLVISLI